METNGDPDGRASRERWEVRDCFRLSGFYHGSTAAAGRMWRQTGDAGVQGVQVWKEVTHNIILLPWPPGGTTTTSRHNCGQTAEEGSIHWALSSDPSSIFCVFPSLSFPFFPLYFYFLLSPYLLSLYLTFFSPFLSFLRKLSIYFAGWY